MMESIIYFHKNGKPGSRFNLNPEQKKRLNRKLRDENIQIAEERGRKDLVENSTQSIEFHLTPSQIRRKLKGGKFDKKENR